MLVVVVTMCGVTVPAVHVVDMVAMLDGLVTTAGPVGVLMHLGGHVGVDLVLVVVAIVLVMRVTVVQIVDMTIMLDRDMTAVSRVLVAVLVMDLVCLCRRHSSPLSPESSWLQAYAP